MSINNIIITSDDRILVTGANGFIGSKVVESLLSYGFRNIRCFVRPSTDLTKLNTVADSFKKEANVEIFSGTLTSMDDCIKATDGAKVIYHLAAGIGKSFSGCFLNSVVTTKNLLEGAIRSQTLKRFVNVSSFAVYSNQKIKRGGLLDESCEAIKNPLERGEAYCFGKVKQDEIVIEYNQKHRIPYVIVRPGAVYGPGKHAITGRVGIGTFGLYLHLGGSNTLPLTYVSNCADAIVLAGLKKGVDGEVFNIVDDDLPTSREFLKMYKKKVGRFTSISIPYQMTYLLCYLWEKYSEWSDGQLPRVFNRSRCSAEWKGNRYSNRKLKELLGWSPKVSTEKGLDRYFAYQREAGGYKSD